MRRPSKDSTPKLSAESLRLASISQAMVQVASRLEERVLERQLEHYVTGSYSAAHRHAQP